MPKQISSIAPRLIAGVLLMLATAATVLARGVSPYLPLQLEPEIERQIERVLILADKPALTRPIAAATVLDALPKACQIDADLCGQVRRFLNRYMHSNGIAHGSISLGATSGAEGALPNRHGLNNDSAWEASAGIYWQFNDHALVSLGGLAYEGETVPVGSMVSLGFSKAQLDIGYRDHWLSPMTDSSMLIGTEAPTMASVTLSNYESFTRLGLRYEVFAARMSHSDLITYEGGLTSGNPRLAGLHLSAEPASGWALGLNRLMQYGGGARGGSSVQDIFDALFKPSQYDNVASGDDPQFGNQLASITSQFLFPGKTPFSVYFEYAGEDTSRGRDYLLGNSALSAGIRFPRVFKRFDLTFETSEWQNAWYVNSLYGDGLTNKGHVLGHWAGDQRVFGDAIGGQSQMLRLGWDLKAGQSIEVRARTLRNESYSTADYERGYDLTVRYSRPLGLFLVGGEALAGRDVFGEDFSRVAAFIRYAPEGGRGFDSGFTDSTTIPVVKGLEVFVDAGINASKVSINLEDTVPLIKRDMEIAPHLGLGARRAVSERNDLGARLELDDIDGNLLIAVRALDYRYRFEGPLALTAFIGAARYDLATPAYGLYGGVGVQWRNILEKWDLGADLRYADKVARDNLLPEDPVGPRGDSFYDISSALLYLSRRF